MIIMKIIPKLLVCLSNVLLAFYLLSSFYHNCVFNAFKFLSTCLLLTIFNAKFKHLSACLLLDTQEKVTFELKLLDNRIWRV